MCAQQDAQESCSCTEVESHLKRDDIKTDLIRGAVDNYCVITLMRLSLFLLLRNEADCMGKKVHMICFW